MLWVGWIGNWMVGGFVWEVYCLLMLLLIFVILFGRDGFHYTYLLISIELTDLFGILLVVWIKRTIGSIDRCIAEFYLSGLSKLSNQ